MAEYVRGLKLSYYCITALVFLVLGQGVALDWAERGSFFCPLLLMKMLLGLNMVIFMANISVQHASCTKMNGISIIREFIVYYSRYM